MITFKNLPEMKKSREALQNVTSIILSFRYPKTRQTMIRCPPSNLSDAFFNFDQYYPRNQISSNQSTPLLKPSFSYLPNDINDSFVAHNYSTTFNNNGSNNAFYDGNSINEPFDNSMPSQIRHSSTSVSNSFLIGSNYSQDLNNPEYMNNMNMNLNNNISHNMSNNSFNTFYNPVNNSVNNSMSGSFNNPMNNNFNTPMNNNFNNPMNNAFNNSMNNAFNNPMNNNFNNPMNNAYNNGNNSILARNGESRVYYSPYEYYAAQLYEQSLKKELELLVSKGDLKSEINKRTEEFNYIYAQLQTPTGFIPLSLDPEERNLLKVKFYQLIVLDVQDSQSSETQNEEEDKCEQDPTIFENCLSLLGQCSALAKSPDAKELHAINIKLNSVRIRACIHNSHLPTPYKLCKYGIYSVTVNPDQNAESVQRDLALVTVKQTIFDIQKILNLTSNDDVVTGIQNLIDEKQKIYNNYQRIGQILEIPDEYDENKIEEIIKLEHEVYSTLEPLFKDNIVSSVINMQNENQLLKEICNYDSDDDEGEDQDQVPNQDPNQGENTDNITEGEDITSSENKSKDKVKKNDSQNYLKMIKGNMISGQNSSGKLSKKLLEKIKNQNGSGKTIMWMTEQATRLEKLEETLQISGDATVDRINSLLHLLNEMEKNSNLENSGTIEQRIERVIMESHKSMEMWEMLKVTYINLAECCGLDKIAKVKIEDIKTVPEMRGAYIRLLRFIKKDFDTLRNRALNNSRHRKIKNSN